MYIERSTKGDRHPDPEENAEDNKVVTVYFDTVDCSKHRRQKSQN